MLASRLKLRPSTYGIGILVIYGAAFYGLLVWLLYLNEVTPVVSRADFVLALWHLLPDLESGDLGGTLAGIFQIFGGHIVAYTRMFQITNYWFFDYNPLIVKYSVLVTFGFAWITFANMARRATDSSMRAAFVVLLATGLICSPVTYGLISWPDSVLPYYSCFIVLCLLLPHVCRWVASPGLRNMFLAALAAFAVLCGSGVGWAALPTFLLTWMFARGHVERLMLKRGWHIYLLGAFLAMCIIAGLGRILILEFMRIYEAPLHLDEARASLLAIVENPVMGAKFFFAILATNVLLGPVEETYGFGVIAFAFWLWLVGRSVIVGESQRLNLWISFGVFGMLSTFLTTLARWNLMITLGLTHASQYYSVFALPVHLSTIALAIELAHRDFRKQHWVSRMNGCAVAGGMAVLVMYAALNLADRHSVYLNAVREGASVNGMSLLGAADRNLLLLSDFTGSPQFVEMYLFGVMHDLKRAGKYPALTARYVVDAKAFAAEHGIVNPLDPSVFLSQRTEHCLPGFGDGRVSIAEPDRRRVWKWINFEAADNAFVRVAGYAIDPMDCSRSADFLLAVDREGEILCVSRPGLHHAATLRQSLLPPIEFRESVFDFSCPVREDRLTARSPYTVVGYYKSGSRIHALPFDDTPLDRSPISAKLDMDQVLIDSKPAPNLPMRGGWLTSEAGRKEADSIILDGWGVDRSRNKTAAAILVFKGERLIDAVEPTVAFPGAEEGITLSQGRRAGFRIIVPFTEVSGPGAVRVFVLTEDGEVSELYYPEAFPDFSDR